MGEHRSICRYGGHWMNFPSGENPGCVIVTDVAEGVLSCMMRVEESLSRDRYNWMHSQRELTGLEASEPCSFRCPTENDFPKVAPRTTNGHFCENVPALGADSVPQLEVNVAIGLCPDIDDLTGDLVPPLLVRLLAR